MSDPRTLIRRVRVRQRVLAAKEPTNTNRTKQVKATLEDIRGTWQGLRTIDVQHTLATQTNEAPPGLTFSKTGETGTYTARHTIEDGVERIIYVPENRLFQTPILMQHGMWHAAWSWHTTSLR